MAVDLHVVSVVDFQIYRHSQSPWQLFFEINFLNKKTSNIVIFNLKKRQ